MFFFFNPIMEKESVIEKLDRLNKEEILDEEKTIKRLEDCLGKLSESDAYNLKRSYSDLWHRLFLNCNQEKEKEKRIMGPVGILEEYCRLQKNHSELNKLDSPRIFSNKFVGISFNLRLNQLGEYYKRGYDTLRRVHIRVEEKTLNNKDVYKKIKETFYEVPKGWLLIQNED